MAAEFSKRFYDSKQWQECRASYIKKVHGLCERCQEPGLILHHKIQLTADNINDPYITLSHDNLEYLCLECHNMEHMGSASLREGLTFDRDGQIRETAPIGREKAYPLPTGGASFRQPMGGST